MYSREEKTAKMTNDTNFNAKTNPTPSIMEPIDETPSLTLTASLFLFMFLCYSKKKTILIFSFLLKYKYNVNNVKQSQFLSVMKVENIDKMEDIVA